MQIDRQDLLFTAVETCVSSDPSRMGRASEHAETVLSRFGYRRSRNGSLSEKLSPRPAESPQNHPTLVRPDHAYFVSIPIARPHIPEGRSKRFPGIQLTLGARNGRRYLG